MLYWAIGIPRPSTSHGHMLQPQQLQDPPESPSDYADQMMKDRYRPNWEEEQRKGPNSERNKIKKAAEDRRRMNQ